MKSNLEKSHSKWSNFKLMLLSIFASISIPFILYGMSLILDKNYNYCSYLIIGAGALSFLLSFVLFIRFKR